MPVFHFRCQKFGKGLVLLVVYGFVNSDFLLIYLGSLKVDGERVWGDNIENGLYSGPYAVGDI